MEIKYTIITKDRETGAEHNVGYQTTVKSCESLLNILVTGADPNHLVDIVIHPEISKEVK